ncbi:hypothetical protein ACFFV7_01670 [Nonomuraea spiralis]|uniref:Uncharacterized protein n=1 Tax=Nonomuraea spiralis TaxID=46182 RepID=A0ABV5I5S9_9ACTN|nr:hypothetical protein [Nonomuraea spiralis]GGS64340.1 hypothetical protein GCM10010176_003350 [Nonomuraea spiralis]
MADVVVDPGVPPDDACLLRDNRRLLLRMRGGWVPERPGRGGAAWPYWRLGAICGATVCLGMLLGAGAFGRSFGMLLLLLLSIPLAIGTFVRNGTPEDEEVAYERQVHARAARHEGRYVLIDDLDEPSRRLLRRAQRAVATVTESRVNTHGLLDDVRNAVMLPAQEWEIARLLGKLSGLRARHRRTLAGESTPEVADVARPLAKALDSSEQAVLGRVEDLERYAANVAEAERAYRAREQIAELRGRLHEYEELLAEAGAGDAMTGELARLTEDADRLDQALRRSVSSAHEAFRYLEPRPPDPPAPKPGPPGP